MKKDLPHIPLILVAFLLSTNIPRFMPHYHDDVLSHFGLSVGCSKKKHICHNFTINKIYEWNFLSERKRVIVVSLFFFFIHSCELFIYQYTFAFTRPFGDIFLLRRNAIAIEIAGYF